MSSIVTGDRYLESLVRFVDRNADTLIDGTLTLKLNPVGLHYVHSRIDALRELESLLAGAPVDYLRAYVSDLGDHRALEQLRRILGLLTSLKVISVLPPPTRDPTPISLLFFGRLKVLELRGCDLSTSAARGLLELRHSLEKLICHNSTDALRHVFASRIVDIKDSPAWNRLSFVSCACNGLVLMDESLQLLPAVETLDLSRNQFAKVANLRKCTKLQHLDLGFNHLRSIASLGQVSCRIVKIVLRHNALTTLRGIENLKSVEGLDLSYNLISSFTELEILASFPCLQNLWLEGNPLCCARWYRSHVFSFFSYPEKLILDENVISTREYWQRQLILASRQKLPSGHGFYFPAKDEAEDDSNFNLTRKKYYRLASIEDEEQRGHICSETAEQESISCDSDNQIKDENAISDGESEIVSLMNKIEHMKKERSVLWLRELKEWMDQSSADEVHSDQHTMFNLCPDREKYIKQSNGERLLGESSSQVLALQASEGDTIMLKSAGVHGNGHFDPNCKTNLEHSVVDDNDFVETSLRTEGTHLKQGPEKAHSQKPHKLSRLEVKTSHPGSLADVGEKVENINSAPLTAIDEIMGSRSSSLNPGSPPHYQEDILQRRLYLEEEFLQLSAESQSLASSDSDTSCSEDDSYKSSSYVAHIDPSLLQESMDHNFMDNAAEINLKNKGHGESLEEGCMSNNHMSYAECFYQPGSCMEKQLFPNHNTQFSSHGNSEDPGGFPSNVNLNQCDQEMERQRCKQKHKRRIVSLLANPMVRDTGAEFSRSDRGLDVRSDDVRDKNGQLSCGENYVNLSSEGSIAVISNDGIDVSPSKTMFCNPDQDQFIKDFFHLRLADSEASETSHHVVCCGCIYQLESAVQEREVALLRSSKNKLYLLLIDVIDAGQESVPEILGIHRLEELREVVVGLGLQVMRVHMEGDATYVFLPRTSKKSEDLLYLLGVGGCTTLNTGCSIRSWEQVQVHLLESCICGSIEMGIVFYSMLLFWHDNQEGESWVSRSVVIVEGFLLVCIEDLVHFSVADDSGPPYYALDSCCHIQNILEVVLELNNDRCLTLTLNNFPSNKISAANKIAWKTRPENMNSQVLTWKFRWFSEETLLKFAAVLKAVHLGLTTTSLPLRCTG